MKHLFSMCVLQPNTLYINENHPLHLQIIGYNHIMVMVMVIMMLMLMLMMMVMLRLNKT